MSLTRQQEIRAQALDSAARLLETLAKVTAATNENAVQGAWIAAAEVGAAFIETGENPFEVIDRPDDSAELAPNQDLDGAVDTRPSLDDLNPYS